MRISTNDTTCHNIPLHVNIINHIQNDQNDLVSRHVQRHLNQEVDVSNEKVDVSGREKEVKRQSRTPLIREGS
jgi:hypothetical protein